MKKLFTSATAAAMLLFSTIIVPAQETCEGLSGVDLKICNAKLLSDCTTYGVNVMMAFAYKAMNYSRYLALNEPNGSHVPYRVMKNAYDSNRSTRLTDEERKAITASCMRGEQLPY